MATNNAINLWTTVFHPFGDHIFGIFSFCISQNRRWFVFVVLCWLNYLKTINNIHMVFQTKQNKDFVQQWDKMRILQSLVLCKTQPGFGADSWMLMSVFQDCSRSEAFRSSREQTWSWSHYLCITLIPICGSFAWVKCQSLWHLAQLVQWSTMTVWHILIWIFFSLQYSISCFATCPLASLWMPKTSFNTSGLESSLGKSLLARKSW